MALQLACTYTAVVNAIFGSTRWVTGVGEAVGAGALVFGTVEVEKALVRRRRDRCGPTRHLEFAR